MQSLMDCFTNIISEDSLPLVFRNVVDSWPASNWTFDFLSQQCGEDKYSCKVAPLDTEGGLWETECDHVDVTLGEFSAWIRGDRLKQSDVLYRYNTDKVSCYIDYKYMKQMFPERPDLLKSVDWGSFGFPECDGKDSTIWIGSKGCYTNCHYDTYGFNLVVQIVGRKRWVLFPPSDSKHLYPTRIPYEESSVFSEVNIKHSDFKAHPNYKLCHPYVVELEPGEALYVPRHWWHFVECLEPSISINMWIESEDDISSHLDEAIAKCLFSCMMEAKTDIDGPEGFDRWLNPGEEIPDHQESFRLVQVLGKTLKDKDYGNKGKRKCKNLIQFANHFKGMKTTGRRNPVTKNVTADRKRKCPDSPLGFGTGIKIPRSDDGIEDTGTCQASSLCEDNFISYATKPSVGTNSFIDSTTPTRSSGHKRCYNVKESYNSEVKSENECDSQDKHNVDIFSVDELSFSQFYTWLIDADSSSMEGTGKELFLKNDQLSLPTYACSEQADNSDVTEGRLQSDNSDVTEGRLQADNSDVTEGRLQADNSDVTESRLQADNSDVTEGRLQADNSGVTEGRLQADDLSEHSPACEKPTLDTEINFDKFAKYVMHPDVIQLIRKFLIKDSISDTINISK